MVQYIRKDTLVNKIEARIQKLLPMVGFATTLKGASMQAASEELKHILSFLNTIEVKEVGLRKDFELTWEDVAWIVNETILKCKVESALTAEDICKDVLKLFKAHKGDIV